MHRSPVGCDRHNLENVMTHTLPHVASRLGQRAVLILLALLLCTCSLGPSADRPSIPTGDPAVITFACLDHECAGYQELADDFQDANPDVRVQLISANEASGMQQQGSTITSDGSEVQRLAAAADTFAWYASLQSADWRYLLDLGPFVQDPSFPADDFYPGTLAHFQWRGGTFGLPARLLPYLVFYDREMFDAAGIPYPEPGWTWDDLLVAASQLTQVENGTVTRYGFVDGTPAGTLLALPAQYGVALWDEDADPPQPAFDTPQVAEVVQRYVDLVRVHGIMPEPEIGSNLLTSQLIDGGKAAMWTGMAFEHDRHAARTRVGVAPFPEAAAAANPSSLYGFFMSAGTAHPDAAWRWLSYLSANYQPSSPSGTLPGRRSSGETMSWWRRLDKETRAAYEYALAHPAASGPIDTMLWGAAARVFRDGVAVDEALARAQERAIEAQAELAQAAPTAPRPVAAALPTPAPGETAIRFAPAPGNERLYRALATAFQAEHPGIAIEIVPYASDLLALPAAADCFAGPAQLADPSSGMQSEILNLDPLLSADASLDLADFYPQFLSPMVQGGSLWGLPYGGDALMVYFNPDLFAAAGLPLPSPGWTMDDFLSTALALSGDGRYGFATREGAYGDLLFVLERLGARLVDDDHDPPRPAFDDPSVSAALEQYAGLARQAALTPATPSTQSGWPDASVVGDHPAGVASGDVAMWVDYLTDYAAAPPLPFEAAVAPLPLGDRATTEFDVRAFYISARSAAPHACWEWITYLSAQPQVATALPARQRVAASPEWRAQVGEIALPAYHAALEYGDAPVFRLRWEIPWLAYTYPWLDAAFKAVVAGENAHAALATVQAQAEQLIACAEAGGTPADREVLRQCAHQIDPNYP